MKARSAPKKLDPESLWDYALKALGQRAHSANELRSKLLRRADASAVQETMGKLREYGLIDDRKFSEAFAAARLQNQGFGRYRVLRDLQVKRVPSQIAKQSVEKTFAGADEHALIERFLERKYKGKDLREFLKQEKNLASVYRRLRTAGFSGNTALKMLKRYNNQMEDFPDNEEPESDL